MQGVNPQPAGTMGQGGTETLRAVVHLSLSLKHTHKLVRVVLWIQAKSASSEHTLSSAGR